MPSIKQSLGSEHVSLDDVCALIEVEHYKDAIGQDKVREKEPRQIFCSRLSAGRQEFFQAGQAGLRAEMVMLVDSDEYDNEPILIYKDNRYTVYRPFMRSDGYTELYCEVRANGSKSQRISEGNSQIASHLHE